MNASMHVDQVNGISLIVEYFIAYTQFRGIAHKIEPVD
jgi:hypothetical protein